MKTIHFADQYLISPQHEITVALIGAGGTGSQTLTCLGRMDATLKALGHPGLFITVYDPDFVTRANRGRQLFSESDIGLNKASCLITRLNRFFATDWKAVPSTYSGQEANIIITCTDNIASRLYVHEVFQKEQDRYIQPYDRFIYWLDFGNTRYAGQAILGSRNINQPGSEKYKSVSRLPAVTELFDYTKMKENNAIPSCSLAEALKKQDLFINSTLAQLGCSLLWKLFIECAIDYQGVFLNVDTLKTNPLKIKST